MELESAEGGYVSDDVKPRSATDEDKSQHQLMPEHYQTSAFVGQKQGSLADNEMGFNPCSGDNEVSSHVSKPPSDYPSDEDHSEGAVESNVSDTPSESKETPMEMEQRQMSESNGELRKPSECHDSDVLISNTPVDAVNASTKVDEDHAERVVEPDVSNTPSEPKETSMEIEQRQIMSEPNGELRTPSECHDVIEGKNLETPLPPETIPESFDSRLFSMSMDKNNDSSRNMKMQDEYQIASSDDDSPTSSKQEHSSDAPRHHSSQSGQLFGNFGSETQYPPTQVMERPADTASPSSYRIPSHVFATEPTGGAEWSVASNESLFSIHIGNMSFSKDMYWLGKYDEFDKPGETSMPNSQTNTSGDVSNSQLSPHMANQISLSQPTLDDEPRAAGTMREVITENKDENLKEGTHRSRPPHHSKGSTKSFAFPVLTDVQRIGSSIIFQGKQKTEVESHPQTNEETSKEAQQLKETSNEQKQPKSATTATSNGCFSCFSCCALGQGQSS